MRRDWWTGDLSLATSRPGMVVRCVQLPGEQFRLFWDKILNLQALHFKPVLKMLYEVRANVMMPLGFHPHFTKGVLLSEYQSKKPLKNAVVNLNGGIYLEPFFPFECFDVVGGSRP